MTRTTRATGRRVRVSPTSTPTLAALYHGVHAPGRRVCKILQYKCDSYAVVLEAPGDAEDIGDVFGVKQEATRTAFFGRKAYSSATE